MDYKNIKFPDLFDRFRYDFDDNVNCFGLIGAVGSGKSVVAVDKLCVQYPMACGIPNENDEIHITTAIIRKDINTLLRTIHEETIMSLYKPLNMIVDGLQVKNPDNITIHFSFMKDGKKIKVFNKIHYISLYDLRAEEKFIGYQPNATLISEPKNMIDSAFIYLPVRVRNMQGVTRPCIVYEGEVPRASSEFFELFQIYGERERNKAPQGFIINTDPNETGVAVNRLYVGADATSQYAFNLSNLPNGYYENQMRLGENHIKNRLKCLPSIDVDGKHAWDNFRQDRHLQKVSYIQGSPVYLFFDADAKGVVGLVQTQNNQIRFLEIIDTRGSITQKIESAGAYLRDKCPNFTIGTCYVDPAINNMNEFLGNDGSAISQFRHEAKRVFGREIKFKVAQDRQGQPAISREVRRNAAIKAFRDLDDGRVGMVINDGMERDNMRKVEEDISKYVYTIRNDGSENNKPNKNECSDIIEYAAVVFGSYDDTIYEDERDKVRRMNRISKSRQNQPRILKKMYG